MENRYGWEGLTYARKRLKIKLHVHVPFEWVASIVSTGILEKERKKKKSFTGFIKEKNNQTIAFQKKVSYEQFSIKL